MSTVDALLNPVLKVIVEARVSVSNWEDDTPNSLHDLLRRYFPNIASGGMVVAVGAARASEEYATLPHAAKITMWNADGTELLQVGADVIIASCLDFSTWENFMPGLKAGADAVSVVLKPARLEYLSVRIINYFNLDTLENEDVDLRKFFGFFAVLPPRFRKIEELKVAFQTILKSDQKYIRQERNQIRLDVQLRNAFAEDFTELAFGVKSELPVASAFLLDIKASCDCQGAFTSDLLVEIAEQLHFAITEVLRSIMRPALLKKYYLQEK